MLTRLQRAAVGVRGRRRQIGTGSAEAPLAEPGGPARLVPLRRRTYLALLRKLRAEVVAVRVEGSGPLATPDEPPEGMAGQVRELVESLQPDSVLQIGVGHLGLGLPVSPGSTLVVVDRDPGVVARAYAAARAASTTVLPLVMDIAEPTPGRGIADFRRVAAGRRLRAELVVAVGVVHDLVTRQLPGLDAVLDGLTDLSTGWLLVDHEPGVPADLARGWLPFDRFVDRIGQRCEVVKISDAGPGERRLVLVRRRDAELSTHPER
jgi:hypothetical protein